MYACNYMEGKGWKKPEKESRNSIGFDVTDPMRVTGFLASYTARFLIN